MYYKNRGPWTTPDVLQADSDIELSLPQLPKFVMSVSDIPICDSSDQIKSKSKRDYSLRSYLHRQYSWAESTITLLYNHHESLINAAVLIGKIHKVREISGHGWFGRWRSRSHGSCGKACAGHRQATKHGIRNALRNSFCLRGYQIRMQILRPLPMLHRIRPRQPSNLSNLSNQILMTRDSPQTKPFTEASNGTTRQTMAR